jgi:hypothetical protein
MTDVITTEGVTLGLFSKADLVSVSPALERAVIAEDAHDRRETLKLLGKNQLAIQAVLEPDEEVAAIVAHWEVAGYVLVITGRRLLDFKKGRLNSSLQQSDVGRTRLLNQPNGNFLVAIETHEAMMYRDDDMRHFDPQRYLAIKVGDPKVARGVCAIVDAINGLS